MRIRIAWLTGGQQWPDVAPLGIAVFTGPPPPATLVGTLAKFGLEKIETP